jgi:hypothetical protein
MRTAKPLHRYAVSELRGPNLTPVIQATVDARSERGAISQYIRDQKQRYGAQLDRAQYVAKLIREAS